MPSSQSELAGVRALVIEGDADTRFLYECILESEAADVRAACDPDAAMNIVAVWSPTVIVSDLLIEHAAVAGFLRVRAALGSEVPAVAVTGRWPEDAREAALACGFQECAMKPLQAEELIALIKRWSGSSGERRPLTRVR